jgi:ferredoxin
MPSKNKSTFARFFKEDAEAVRDIVYSREEQPVFSKAGAVNKEVLPRMSRPKEMPAEMIKDHWKKLRSFFRNANSTDEVNDLYPVMLSPLLTRSLITTDYPVYIPLQYLTEEQAGSFSLQELVEELLSRIGPDPDDAHILKENVERIVHIANEQLNGKEPHIADEALHRILDHLEKELDVSGDELHPFRNDLYQLRQILPENGELISYSDRAAYLLLAAAIDRTTENARQSLKAEIRSLKSRLGDMLSIERAKNPTQNQPDDLKENMEFADSMMDFDQLSSLLPGASTEFMDESRVERIAAVVQKLESSQPLFDQSSFLFMDDHLKEILDGQWGSLEVNASITTYTAGNGCSALKNAFDQHIVHWADLFKAKRIAELEVKNAFRPEIHDAFFSHFSWHSFSREEMNCCPYFMLLSDDISLFEMEFSRLSAILSANMPVKIVAVRRAINIDENMEQDTRKASAWNANAELGALLLSYKNIYIHQCSAITPKELYSGFIEGLQVFAPAFFYLMNPHTAEGSASYLKTSAAVESRDFPCFTYRGLIGTAWGSRFDMRNNPQPELSWPMHGITVVDQEGNRQAMDIAFTYADHAVKNKDNQHHFMPVPAACWDDDLVPLEDFVRNESGEYGSTVSEGTATKVPYIWMMNDANVLHRVAVSWPVVVACRERQDFWRFLQENSGINNFHVARAVEETRQATIEEMELEIARIRMEHEAEIERVREEEAGNVMEQLTSVLLDLDTTPAFTRQPRPPSKAPATGSAESPEPAEMDEAGPGPEKDQEEVTLSNDPYIDTALCTSCNECTELNPAMFRYNKDKMAYIEDADAGSYRELVEAAEKCPVSIIHPGAPRNPEEPGLEDLIERAAKYN